MNDAILSYGTKQITISTTDITENWTKALISVAYPLSSNEQDKAIPINNYAVKILDILSKMERRVTISGHLSTGYGSGDSSTNAQDKATDLRNLFMQGGLFTLTYYAGTFDGSTSAGAAIMDKLEIKKIANDVPDNTDGVAEFDVQISILIGNNMVSGS